MHRKLGKLGGIEAIALQQKDPNATFLLVQSTLEHHRSTHPDQLHCAVHPFQPMYCFLLQPSPPHFLSPVFVITPSPWAPYQTKGIVELSRALSQVVPQNPKTSPFLPFHSPLFRDCHIFRIRLPEEFTKFGGMGGGPFMRLKQLF